MCKPDLELTVYLDVEDDVAEYNELNNHQIITTVKVTDGESGMCDCKFYDKPVSVHISVVYVHSRQHQSWLEFLVICFFSFINACQLKCAYISIVGISYNQDLFHIYLYSDITHPCC